MEGVVEEGERGGDVVVAADLWRGVDGGERALDVRLEPVWVLDFAGVGVDGGWVGDRVVKLGVPKSISSFSFSVSKSPTLATKLTIDAWTCHGRLFASTCLDRNFTAFAMARAQWRRRPNIV